MTNQEVVSYLNDILVMFNSSMSPLIDEEGGDDKYEEALTEAIQIIRQIERK